MPAPQRSPRERYRDQTRAEAKEVALDQLAESGPAGISLNAIAKRMGITGPALYRYFENRDALLSALIVDAYRDMAEAVEAAAEQHRKKAPAGRLREVALEWRRWALAQPHRYLLLYGTPVPGYAAPEETYELADRALRTLQALFAELVPADLPPGRTALDRQLTALRAKRSGEELPAAALRRGVLAWTRLYGVLSLEVQGQFAGTGVDPELLFRAEIDSLLAEPW
ncbi:TetR/AcrR family transcriptional regulator [Saccharopolyspora gloriosae]|uniref:AcrR family transcriptional regulator n=1 Tax=Saccharopolyspora gloriosae TaxID=455344 RepID=A0A840NNP0_9PSEU|nr:TetR/AcrR family transcriptional regulator [Saccharopolyspora gloriosae]MBB5071968.1 AcrR family transcriptional regulator [Saccharopolyspora gloriosae]